MARFALFFSPPRDFVLRVLLIYVRLLNSANELKQVGLTETIKKNTISAEVEVNRLKNGDGKFLANDKHERIVEFRTSGREWVRAGSIITNFLDRNIKLNVKLGSPPHPKTERGKKWEPPPGARSRRRG